MTIDAAQTIQQLGGMRIFAMAFKAPAMVAEHAVTFRIAPGLSRLTQGRATHVRVTLAPTDLYGIELIRVSRSEPAGRVLEQRDHVDAASLARTVEAVTGLRLSL